MTQRNHFQNLPHDILKEILRYLSAKQLGPFSRTSKAINETVNKLSIDKLIKLNEKTVFKGTYGQLGILLNKDPEKKQQKIAEEKLVQTCKEGNECLVGLCACGCCPVGVVAAVELSTVIGGYAIPAGCGIGIGFGMLVSAIGFFCEKLIEKRKDEIQDAYPELISNPHEVQETSALFHHH